MKLNHLSAAAKQRTPRADARMASQREEVCFRKLEKKWESIIKVDGKSVHLGFFESESTAHKKCRSIAQVIDAESKREHPWAVSGMSIARNGRPFELVSSSTHFVGRKSNRRPVPEVDVFRLSSSQETRSARLDVSSMNTQKVLRR